MSSSSRVLIFGGASGWIAGQLKAVLAPAGFEAVDARSRMENLEEVAKELDAVKPQCVIIAAGLTGRPNIDSLETQKALTSLVNVAGTVGVASLCALRGIHVINFATGCIYEYDAAHPVGGPGFTEDDPPNFFGSYYSRTKVAAEASVKELPGHLLLRVRMPITCDASPRCFVTKIAKYDRVVDVPNSVTVLPDLLPLIPGFITARTTGVLNFVNPGPVSHSQILDAYKELVDTDYTYEVMDMATHDTVVVARRSNNCLDTSRLEAAAKAPDGTPAPIPDALASIRALLASQRPRLSRA